MFPPFFFFYFLHIDNIFQSKSIVSSQVYLVFNYDPHLYFQNLNYQALKFVSILQGLSDIFYYFSKLFLTLPYKELCYQSKYVIKSSSSVRQK